MARPYPVPLRGRQAPTGRALGDTRTKAGLALRKALVTITASAAVEVRREMRLSVRADRFLQSEANLARRSLGTYRQTIEHHIKPNIGELAISEATTERLQRFVTRIQLENGPGAAKASVRRSPG